MKFIFDNTEFIFELNQVIPEFLVYSFIQKIHHDINDFEDGDLGSRIEKYSSYIFKKISLDEIVYDTFLVNNNSVENFSNLDTLIPPILVSTKRGKKYFIEDGAHRCYAAKEKGICELYAFVPYAKKNGKVLKTWIV